MRWWFIGSDGCVVSESDTVATPPLIRFVICCVDGYEWIVYSLDAMHTIGNVVFALIKDEYKMWS